ncbi:type 4 pilus major pilin [Pandoraea cepalis]|nr:type 4 pilus major pilin [Pandoraea cepalis]
MDMQVNEGALVQMKNKMKGRWIKRGQRGVTLVELSVAVAVMGLIMAGAMVGVPRLMNSVRVNQEIKDWQMAVVSIQNAVLSGQLTAKTSPQDMDKMGLFGSITPSPAGTVGEYLNRFGGTLKMAPITAKINDGPNFGVEVTSEDVPSDQCQKFMTTLHSNFTTVTVNGTNLKNLKKPFEMGNLAAACQSSNMGGEDANQKNDLTKAKLEFTISGS